MTVLQISSPGSHQRADCSLTRGVDAEGGGTLNPRDGAVENDRATILQERQCLLHGKQRSPYIDVEQLVEMLFGDGPEGNKFANTGVGENNIDSPLHLGDDLVETIKVGQFGNVSLNARNVAADCLYGLVELLLATARDEDVGALFDEKSCRSQPNPFRAPGDDCYFPLQLLTFGHRRSPPYPLPQFAPSTPSAPELDRRLVPHRSEVPWLLEDLASDHSSIHWDGCPCHVRRICRSDKGDHMGDLLWCC